MWMNIGLVEYLKMEQEKRKKKDVYIYVYMHVCQFYSFPSNNIISGDGKEKIVTIIERCMKQNIIELIEKPK